VLRIFHRLAIRLGTISIKIVIKSLLLWKGGEQASRKEEQKTDSSSHGEREEAQHTSSFSSRLQAGSELMCSCALPLPLSPLGLFERDFSQPNTLDGGPDDGQATHLRGEDVNLVGALTDAIPKVV
jgi:hypothetical protein